MFESHPWHEGYRLVPEVAVRFGAKVFVETGSNVGDMLKACLGSFDVLYGVEARPDLFGVCCGRFWGVGKVRVLQGDSGLVLKELLPRISGSAVFWLDAHKNDPSLWPAGGFDGPESALSEELPTVLAYCVRHPGSVVLIDDKHLLKDEKGYLSEGTIKGMVLKAFPSARFEEHGRQGERDLILMAYNFR